MDEQLKQRLVGAIVLVLLAVVFIPMVLEPPPERPAPAPAAGPSSGEAFSSSIVRKASPVPVPEPVASRATPLAAAPPPPAATKPRPAPAPAVEPRGAAQPARAADAVQAPAQAGGWVVQLGSFSNDRNAKALRDRLTARGFAVFLRTATSARGTVTRVYVGPSPSRDEALGLVGALERETSLKGIVVRNPLG